MINEISVNSNNTIQLSRGELLAWLNDLLNTNITKIQQLGTGALYCQLLDLLYPAKVQLNKVNFKAKNDYEYINNFKLLQQYFTKFGIMKHIEVERLIKCKYQDNLQFLQWFKKIFDNHYTKNDNDTSIRRSVSDNETNLSLQKENKRPTKALIFDGSESNQNSINDLLKLQFSKQGGSQRPNHTATSRSRYDDKLKRQKSLLKPSTERHNSYEIKADISVQNMELDQSSLPKSAIKQNQVEGQNTKQPYYSPSKFIEKQNFYKYPNQSQGYCNQQREFYLRKFKAIQHLLEVYQNNQHCSQLVSEVRKVILMTPEIKDWVINEQTGEVVCSKKASCSGPNQVSTFTQTPEDNTTQSPPRQNGQLPCS